MKKGFTLTELLVVIGIIGILSSMILLPVRWGVSQSKDARRVEEVYQIGRTIQQYYVSFGEIPSGTADGVAGCAAWDVGNYHFGDNKFLQSLVSSGFVDFFPLEFSEKDSMRCNYRYLKGACGCTNGAILYAKCEANKCPQEERPDCCSPTICPEICSVKGSVKDKGDIFIYFEEK